MRCLLTLALMCATTTTGCVNRNYVMTWYAKDYGKATTRPAAIAAVYTLRNQSGSATGNIRGQAFWFGPDPKRVIVSVPLRQGETLGFEPADEDWQILAVAGAKRVRLKKGDYIWTRHLEPNEKFVEAGVYAPLRFVGGTMLILVGVAGGAGGAP